MPRERKQFPLRVPQELYDVYEAWAADEFRSVNAQIEAVLVDAARRAGRLRRRPAGGQGRGATSAEDPT
jgi:hypothetical protein